MLFRRASLLANSLDQTSTELRAEIKRTGEESQKLAQQITRLSDEVSSLQRAFRIIKSALDAVDRATLWTNRLPGIGRILSRVIDVSASVLRAAASAIEATLARLPGVVPFATSAVGNFLAHYIPAANLQFPSLHEVVDRTFFAARALEPQQELIERVLPDDHKTRISSHLGVLEAREQEVRRLLAVLRTHNDGIQANREALEAISANLLQLNIDLQTFVNGARYVGDSLDRLVDLLDEYTPLWARAILEMVSGATDWAVDRAIDGVRGALSLVGVDLDALIDGISQAAESLRAQLPHITGFAQAINAMRDLVYTTVQPYSRELLNNYMWVIAALSNVRDEVRQLLKQLEDLAGWKEYYEVLTPENLREFLQNIDELMESLGYNFDPGNINTDEIFEIVLQADDSAKASIRQLIENAATPLNRLLANTNSRSHPAARMEETAGFIRFATQAIDVLTVLQEMLISPPPAADSYASTVISNAAQLRPEAQKILGGIQDDLGGAEPFSDQIYRAEFERVLRSLTGPVENEFGASAFELPDETPLEQVGGEWRLDRVPDDKVLEALRYSFEGAATIERRPLGDISMSIESVGDPRHIEDRPKPTDAS